MVNEELDVEVKSEEAQRAGLRHELDRLVDIAGHDSFPASDAPAWWSAPPKVP